MYQFIEFIIYHSFIIPFATCVTLGQVNQLHICIDKHLETKVLCNNIVLVV